MKNVLKTFGIIAIAAVIGFSMAACDDGSGSGIPSELVGKWYKAGSLIFEITSDGIFTDEVDNYSYDISVSGNTVELKMNGTKVGSFNYSISNGKLTMTNGTGVGMAYMALSPFEKEDNDGGNPSVLKISDTRFNGQFVGTYDTWVFNGTIKAQHTYTSSGNVFDCEIKLEDGHFWNRLWENPYSEWRDDGAYSFDSNGNLKIGSYTYTKTGGGGTIVPSAPTGVMASRSSSTPTTVNISWNAVSGATSYRVYCSLTGSDSGTLEGSPTTTSYASIGNSTTSTWYFRVSAVNSAGEGSPSSWVSVGPASGSGGTFTVTGIPSQYNGKYAIFMSEGSISLLGSTGYSLDLPLVQIANGSVSLPMWTGSGRYSGNHTVSGEIGIFNSASFTSSMITYRTWSSITFSNGSATKTWSSGY